MERQACSPSGSDRLAVASPCVLEGPVLRVRWRSGLVVHRQPGALPLSPARLRQPRPFNDHPA